MIRELLAAFVGTAAFSVLYGVPRRCYVWCGAAGIYWTSYYLVMNEMDQALTTGYEAVKCAAAIVLGIVLAFELPQKLFRRAGKTSGIK